MATIEELQKEHEARLSALASELSGRGRDSDLALVRAMIHRAVHLAAERKAAEFCALSTFLAEMISHAHQLLHDRDQAAHVHHDVVQLTAGRRGRGART